MDIPILIEGAGQVRALGFDFAFDKSHLVFVGWAPGHIIRDWSFTGAQMLADSAQVRVGAFDVGGSVVSGADTVAVLQFEVICGEGFMNYDTRGFVDDLAGAMSCQAAAPLHCETAVEAMPWSAVKRLFH